MSKLIIGMTGSTGAIFGVRLLEALADSDVETHLVVSKWAQQTIEHETPRTLDELRDLATEIYSSGDMGAKVSSGSFHTDGMVVVPCSMRSVAAIAHGNGDHLVHRAADVILKERRKLVLVARETPLSSIHLENLLKLSRMGVTILPPVPAFALKGLLGEFSDVLVRGQKVVPARLLEQGFVFEFPEIGAAYAELLQ